MLSGDPADIDAIDASCRRCSPTTCSCSGGSRWRPEQGRVPGAPGADLLARLRRSRAGRPRDQRARPLGRGVGAGRDRPRSPRLRLGRVAVPRDRGDAGRLRRDRRLADPQRARSTRRPARRGSASITAAASGSATRSTPGWSSSPTAPRTRPSGSSGCSPPIPARASCATPTPATRRRSSTPRERRARPARRQRRESTRERARRSDPRPRAGRDAGRRRRPAARRARSRDVDVIEDAYVLCDGRVDRRPSAGCAISRRSTATSRSSTARALGDPRARRLPHASVLRGRPRQRVLAARRRRDVRGAARRAAAASCRRCARRARRAPTRCATRVARHRGWMRAHGTTTFEGKSRLRARPRHRARAAARGPRRPAASRPGSARTPCRPSSRTPTRYLDFLLAEVLPDAARIAEAADVFLERGAFDVEQARRYLPACRDAGLALRLHGDQFTESARSRSRSSSARGRSTTSRRPGAGGRRRARRERRRRRAASRQRALPRRGRCRPARALVDAGAAIALATDFNPGSAFCESLPARLLARLHADGARARGGARRPCTVNAAHVLGRADRGRDSRRATPPTSSCSTPPTGGTSPTTSAATSSHTVIESGQVAWSRGHNRRDGEPRSSAGGARRRSGTSTTSSRSTTEGNETVLSASELKPANGGGKRRDEAVARSKPGRGRGPQPPSWQRVLKRGAIFAPIFFAHRAAARRRQDDVRHGDRPDAVARRRLHPVQLLHGSRRLAVAAEAPGARARGAVATGAARASTQLALGPIGTNCYVVRADRRLGPRRSSSTRAATPPRSGCASRRPAHGAPRSSSRTATSTTSSASPTSPRARARRCTLPAGRASWSSRSPGAVHAGLGLTVRAYERRDAALAGGETVEVGRDRVRGDRGPGPLAGSPRLPRRRRTCSPATCSSPARSVAPIFPARDWETLIASIGRSLDRFPPETVVYPGHGPTRRSAPSSRGTRSSPSSASARRRRMSRPSRIERPRGTHDVVPAEMPVLAAGHRRDRAALRALRLPHDPDAGVRGHRALRAHLGRGLRRRAEGDVHLHRPLGPLADAAARGHRADLPRLRRARDAPRAAAGEAVHDRVDVPLRRARTGRYREHWQASVEAIGSDDPSIDAELIQLYDTLLAPARRHAVPPRAQLDRLPRVPARVPRARCAPGSRRTSSASTTRRARRPATSPLRVFDNYRREAGRRARGARRGAEDRRVAVRRVRRALRRRPRRPRRDRRRVRARADARARARLLLAHDLGVHRPAGERELDASPAAAATTTSSRRSAGRRRRASGFGAGIERLLIAMEEEGVATAEPPTIDVFFALERRARRATVVASWLAELRARGRLVRHRLRGPLAQGPADAGRAARRRA